MGVRSNMLSASLVRCVTLHVVVADKQKRHDMEDNYEDEMNYALINLEY